MNFIEAAQWGCTILKALINGVCQGGGYNAVNCSVITFIAPGVVLCSAPRVILAQVPGHGEIFRTASMQEG